MKMSSAFVKREAGQCGFAACGIAPAANIESDAPFFDKWLEAGYNAGMEYMANHRDLRMNPQNILEGAKSIICVALNYYPETRRDEKEPYIAYYAYGKDYHKVLKDKLHKLWQKILSSLPEDIAAETRAFTDSAPILERYWAWRTGLGWIGKNTNLIIPYKGSFFFLGEIITSIEADEYDDPIEPKCGSCTRCLDACPTGALRKAYSLDANRCLSYLTIENRGDIPEELRAKLGNRLYGCDTCQSACPWNKFATPTQESAFKPSEELLSLNRKDLENFTEEDYKRIFSGSAVKRAKYEGLARTIRHLKDIEQKNKNF